jgi:heat shock protein HtpX
MNLYDEISGNKRKSYLLILLFILVISALGYVAGLIWIPGWPYLGLIFAAVLSVIVFLVNYYAGDSLILSMSKARPATREEFPYYVNTVEGLAMAAGIPTPKAYVIDEESINAFATGRDPKHASVTVTTGALKKLGRQELEGVVGHELSHIKNFDIRIMMLAAVLVGITALLSDIILRSFIYGKGSRDNKGGNLVIVLIIVGLVFAILSPLIAQLIKLAISRKREYLADANGALLTRYPKGLADALKKIQNDNDKLVDSANKATAHLYIENPLRQHQGFINNMFSTHPPIEERIKRLQAM